MRSSDEMFQEILKRGNHLRERRASQKAILRWALSSAGCAVLLVVAACFLSVFPAGNQTAVSSQYGSLLLNSPYMGYAIIGILAFLLGVCVTLLFIHVRKMKAKERDRK